MHSLERFALAKNDLNGHILPSLFNNTQSIKQISLMNNNLSGPISHNLGSLPKLEFLYLGYNNLSGIVPQPSTTCQGCSGFISHTTTLRVPFLPIKVLAFLYWRSWFSNRTTLWVRFHQDLQHAKTLKFSLWLNYFVDAVPIWLAQLPHLTGLSLAVNNLFGSIPAVLSNLTHLTVLDMGTNQLIGRIPSFLQNFSELSTLFNIYAQQ